MIQHYVPNRERDKHDPTPLCICAPRLFIPVGDLTGKRAYYEHFALDGKSEPKQVYQ